MDSRNVLSDEYQGDAAWRDLVATFRAEARIPQDLRVLLAEISDEEVGIVLATLMEAQCLGWMRRSCRALDDKTPEEVMKSGTSGKRAVRTLLMRMP